MKEAFLGELAAMKEYFDRSTRLLEESDSGYAPATGMFTVAQHVAHVAQTIDWFVEGAFAADGFSMDFEALDNAARQVTSLGAAREWLERAVAAAQAKTAATSEGDWMTPLPAGPVMGGMPRMAIFGAITDHSAHHRGALTVYTRLLGKVPPMPYMEM